MPAEEEERKKTKCLVKLGLVTSTYFEEDEVEDRGDGEEDENGGGEGTTQLHNKIYQGLHKKENFEGIT